ncbi:hypothetical protein BH11BAC2_BH11BAC2_13860 [soil metagenome]
MNNLYKLFKNPLLFVVVALLFLSTGSQAQIYRYTNNAAGNPFSVAVNASGTSLSRVNGATVTATPCPNGFTSQGFTTSGVFSTSHSAIQFTVTPSAGYYLNITNFNTNLRRNGPGPAIAKLAYSTDGGATWNLQTTFQAPNYAGCGLTTPGNWDVPDFSINSPVIFRIYGFSAISTAAGLFQLLNVTVGGSVTLTPVSVPPIVTLNPVAQTVCAGQTATFTSSASGSPVPTISWEVSTNGGGTWTPIPGANTGTLSFSTVIGDNGNLYHAVFTNTGGTVTSTAALLTVNAPATVNAGSDQSICANTTATLNGGIGGGASSSTWATSGDGTFNNATLLNAIYTPGVNDKINGTVTLTLTTNDPTGPCGAVNDAMIISISPVATADAGLAQSICSNSSASLNGAVGGGAVSGSWTTSGDGSFNNVALLNAVYTPGANDILAGTVTLTLTSNDPTGPCESAISNVVITILPFATVDAGTDQTICSNSSATLNGVIGGGASSGTWSTSGDGSFNNAALLNAIYTPGVNDNTNGTVTLTLTTNDPVGPCGAVNDAVIITINAAATVSAGSNQTICSGSTVSLNGSIGGGASSATWSSSGDGLFDNVNLLNPVYTPGTNDITAGTVTLTLTTDDPSGPCVSATSNLIVTVNPFATVNAGADQGICAAGTASLNGSVGGGASSGTWSTSGDGSFNNASLLNAVYTPGSADITAGTITLTLTTNDPAGPCGAVSDNLVVTVTSIPVKPGVIMGSIDACVGTTLNPYSVASVSGATYYVWSGTSGATATGNTVNATYDFAATITNSGSFITVAAGNVCGVSDTSRSYIRHSIDQPQFILPLSTVCPNTLGVVYNIQPIQGAASVVWTAPTGASIASSSDVSATIDFGPAFTGGNVLVTATHLCVVKSKTVTVGLGAATTPGLISGLANGVCDSTLTYSISAVTGAASYLWTAPANATIIGANNALSVMIQFNPGYTTGNVSVVSVNNCGVNSSVRNLGVKGVPLSPATITGPATFCAGQTGVQFTAATSLGAWTYTWTVPSGASVTAGQGTQTVTVTFGNVSGNVNVKAVRPCGISGARSKGVTVNCRLGENADVITVFPNPAMNDITIAWPIDLSETASVSIVDITGRVVFATGSQVTSPQQVNVSEIPSGIYQIKIETLAGNFVQRLLIAH